METTDHGKPDDHGACIAESQRLLAEMERLELRARMLLTEHRHVVDTIRDMQRQLDAAGASTTRS
jgi:hypothetical protein